MRRFSSRVVRARVARILEAVVREYGLGAVFTPGDAGSLGATLQRALDEFDPAGLERVRNERSNRAVALGQLGALDLSVLD